MHLRTWSSIPGLHLLDPGSILSSAAIKNVSRHGQMSPGEIHHPQLRSMGLQWYLNWDIATVSLQRAQWREEVEH